MQLGKLIDELAQLPGDRVVANGFGRPMSYRGYYEDVAFEPATNVSISSMLNNARTALGRTFTGYKGGKYTMEHWTKCWIAPYGKIVDVPITMGDIQLWAQGSFDPTKQITRYHFPLQGGYIDAEPGRTFPEDPSDDPNFVRVNLSGEPNTDQRHRYGLGTNHDVCSICGQHVEKAGLNTPCTGTDTPVQQAVVRAAMDRGFSVGVEACSQMLMQERRDIESGVKPVPTNFATRLWELARAVPRTRGPQCPVEFDGPETRCELPAGHLGQHSLTIAPESDDVLPSREAQADPNGMLKADLVIAKDLIRRWREVKGRPAFSHQLLQLLEAETEEFLK